MRTKQVFPTDEIAHIWANQRQQSARNANNNLSFNGRTIWSYSTVQAELKKDDPNTVFIVNYNYSNTTAKHVSSIRYATNHLKQVFVKYPADVTLYSENFWRNIEVWRNSAIQFLKDAEKPKIQAKTRIKNKEAAIVELQEIVYFLAVFGLTIDTLKNSDGHTYKNPPLHCEKATFDYIIKLVKERESLLDAENHLLDEYNTQKEKAEKEKVKRQEKARKATLKEANRLLQLWLTDSVDEKGRKIDTYRLSNLDKVYLRATPKDNAIQVETSMGARVDIKRAKVLYLAIKNNKDVLGFDIDGYTVVEKTDEHLKIGCHYLLFTEINRFVKTQNW